MYRGLTRSRNRFYISAAAAAAPTYAERITEAARALEAARISAAVTRTNALNTEAAARAGAAISPEEIWIAKRLAVAAARRVDVAQLGLLLAQSGLDTEMADRD